MPWRRRRAGHSGATVPTVSGHNLFPSGCGDLKLLISQTLHVLTNTRSTDEHARLSHLRQLARRCARFTTRGFSWAGACTGRSHRHFVALCARILILHTGHVRHRGVQQHRQEIVDCAGACEFVARVQGELDGGEHDAPSRDLRENLVANHLDFLHVAVFRWCRTAAGVSSGLVHVDSEYSRSSARRNRASTRFDEL